MCKGPGREGGGVSRKTDFMSGLEGEPADGANGQGSGGEEDERRVLGIDLIRLWVSG